MTALSTPVTEAGRTLLRRLDAGTGTPRPFAVYADKGEWVDDVLAIEREAVADLRASLAAAIAALPTQPWWHGPGDAMCPNCVTPWKCNGPHEVSDRAPDGLDVDRAAVLRLIEGSKWHPGVKHDPAECPDCARIKGLNAEPTDD